ncbi:MAG: DUF87 domain-containing protein [bacterium]
MEETKRLLRKLVPALGKGSTNALWHSYLASSDLKSKQDDVDILRIIADRKAKNGYAKNIILPPPDKKQTEGEYPLGDVLYADKIYSEFGLCEDEWIKHMLIVGMTGTGKTNTVFQIIKELKKHDKPFLIFDWKKNCRDLLQFPEFKDTFVFTIGAKTSSFYFNPLIPPPGVDTKLWLGRIIDVICHAYFAGHGVEYFLRDALNDLYERFGVYKGKKVYPTFRDMEKVLKKEFVKGREMLWMASVKRILASLTFPGLFGDVLNVRKRSKLHKLLNKNVILEMDNLATSDKVFFIEALMLWIYEYRKNQTKREEFKHAIIIEEAHHMLSGKKERTKGEETIIETIIRMIREFGESIIAIDQEPNKLSDSIKANTYCKICFNLGNGKDIVDISKCMSLEPEEMGFIDRLNIGQAIVKLKGRFNEPVLVQFPKFEIKKGVVNDETLKQAMDRHNDELDSIFNIEPLENSEKAV